jgi:hypothetical protein
MTTKHDLRRYASAWEARDHLPQLASWMSDDDLKQIAIWDGWSFEANQTYFDLDNPERGPFTATGQEAIPHDWTYVRERDVPPQVWAKLVTWKRPLDEGEGETLARQTRQS